MNIKYLWDIGGDFGVEFFTAYFPKSGIVASALGNTEINLNPLLESIFSSLLNSTDLMI